MSAKEMFEELGYKYGINGFDIEYIRYYFSGQPIKILFSQSQKNVYYSTDVLTLQMFQAIQKQIEELGWENDK